ncbi:MAG: Minf_1886 family protein [Planctomycetota bacterium]
MATELIDPLESVLKKDNRYAREAYAFVFESLEFTLNKIGERRHVTGPELLDGLRQLAINKFGMLAKMVFNHWGVYKTDDFGEIVFNLVETGLMGKTKDDSRKDFQDVFIFDEVFDIKFVMKIKDLDKG